MVKAVGWENYFCTSSLKGWGSICQDLRQQREQSSRVGAELRRMNALPISLAGRMVQRNCKGGCKRACGSK